MLVEKVKTCARELRKNCIKITIEEKQNPRTIQNFLKKSKIHTRSILKRNFKRRTPFHKEPNKNKYKKIFPKAQSVGNLLPTKTWRS